MTNACTHILLLKSILLNSKSCSTKYDFHITISGVCPWSAEETLTSSCIMDHPGCEFDSECDGYGINYKCCYNSKCKYGECKDINKVGC